VDHAAFSFTCRLEPLFIAGCTTIRLVSIADLLRLVTGAVLGFLIRLLYELIRDRRRSAAALPVLTLHYGRSSSFGQLVVVATHICGGDVRIHQVIAVHRDGTGELALLDQSANPVLSQTNTPLFLLGFERAEPERLEDLYSSSVFNLYWTPGELIRGIAPGQQVTVAAQKG
jgi:hypothetical protein